LIITLIIHKTMGKTIYSFLFLLLSLYFVGCVLTYFYQDKLIFYPVKLNNSSPFVKKYRDNEVTINHKKTVLHGWLLNPGKSKLLIYYGGNAEEVSGNLEDFKRFEDHSVLLMNYRGYGNTSGSPSQKNLFEDALYIYDYMLNQSKQKIKNISLFGRSLGSGVATFVASKRPVDKLILVTPFDSIKNIAKKFFPFLPVNLLLKHPFNSVKHVENLNVPILVLIAEKDEVIPYNRSKNLEEHIGGNGKSIVIKNAGHNDIQLFDDYWGEIANFLF